MADVELSALPAASALAGTEKFPVLQTTAKAALISDVNTYVQGQLVAAGAGTAGSGDYLVGFETATIKKFDLDAVAAYVMTYTYAQAAATTPVLGTDTVIADRGGTKIEVSVDTIETYIAGVIAAAADSLATTIAALDAATPGATDTFVFVTTGPVGKEITLANLEVVLWADFATATAALTNQASIADSDIFYKVVGTTDYKTTATEIAVYVQAEMFDAAVIDSGNVLTGDTFLIKRGSDYKTVTGQHIADWVESDIASVLDISTLGALTIGDTDSLLICQGSTPGKEAASDVAAYVLGKFDDYLNALSAVSPATDSDEFYVLQGNVEKRILASTIATYTWAADEVAMKALAAKATPVAGDKIMVQDSAASYAHKLTTVSQVFAAAVANGWKVVPMTTVTATPLSTSSIGVNPTAPFAVGLPVKYTYNSTTYYGIVTAIVENTSITIAGAPLNTGGGANDLSALYVGGPEKVHQETLHVAGTYGNGADATLLLTDLKQYYTWLRPKAYLVTFSATQDTVDTGTEPKINVNVAGAAVSSNDSNNGVQLTTKGAWVANSAVAITVANYDINYGEALELNCTVAGGTGDAADLSVAMTFVYE